MSDAKPKIVELYTSKRFADDQLIAALETMLQRAKAGQVHSLIVVGVDEVTGDTHRFEHNGKSVTAIGALSAMLAKLQNDYNAYEK